MRRESKQAETQIEIFEGAQGNVILRGLKEQTINCMKDLALIYESTVII